MPRVTRILLVTAGLSIAGAFLGALAATIALVTIVATSVLTTRPWGTISPDMLIVAAGEGAIFGLLLGPLTAWLALRRVPLGRALVTTTAGTTVGAILGAPLPIAGPMLGAIAGFLVTSFWLRQRKSVRDSAEVSRVA